MTKLTADSNIADIAARLNQLQGTDADVKTLAKRGKAKLLAKIDELEQAKAAEEAARKAAEAKAAKKADPKAKAEKKKGPVIREVAEGLLREVTDRDEDGRPYGHSYEAVLTLILAQFEGAKTTVACLRWYAVHMRERGEKVPNRPRAATAKKAD